jgi:hypothetical protein
MMQPTAEGEASNEKGITAPSTERLVGRISLSTAGIRQRMFRKGLERNDQ